MERRWVRCRAWGVVTLAEGLALRQRFQEDPRFTSDFYQLFDARDVTRMALTAAEIGELAKSSAFSAKSRRAFVVPTRETYDPTRMYLLYRGINAGNETLRMFQTMEAAEKWLMET